MYGDNMSIKFSVLVPVYNVEDYIAECIQSVLQQTYANFELILVDDGSEDSSGLICDEYSNNKKIKVYHKKNQGLIHTRRYAIEHASGDYYITLDSDDKMELNALEVLAETISKHNCDCVFFNRKRLLGNNIIEPIYHIKQGYVEDRRTIQKRVLIDFPYNSLCLKCAKASLFSKQDYSSYYYIQHGEDLLQSLELLRNCKTAEFIDNSLYIYRLRPNSIVNTKLSQDYCIDLTVRKETLKFVYEEGLFTQEDINEYRDKCIVYYIDQIIEVCSLRISIEKKKKYIQLLREDSYYKEFVSFGITDRKKIPIKKAIIFNLFKNKMDYLLIMMISSYKHSMHKINAN